MIISHSHRFIFIKTSKTAGTSIEAFLSRECGVNDIFTPILPPSVNHVPRNYRGFFNPYREFVELGKYFDKSTLSDLIARRKFYNHIFASRVKARVARKVWNSYFKFAIERNPYDKVFSLYNMLNYRADNRLSVAEFFDKGLYKNALNTKYYTDRFGNVNLDKIIRYEVLDSALTEIFKNLGIPFCHGLNIREKGDYRRYQFQTYQDLFSSNDISLITEFYDQEFSLWGYKKYQYG